jgi:hypothetical protein
MAPNELSLTQPWLIRKKSNYLLHAPRHKRQPARLVNRVNELLLLRRRLPSRPLHLDCQKPASLRNTTNDV